MISSGMGSSLHTWMDPLCHAVEHNKVLVTGGNFWLWNDKEVCYDEFQRKKVFKAQDAKRFSKHKTGQLVALR